ncbi:MAG: 30S ribosomal protein S5 [Fimbriimonadaceae bacterium]|nr:30S ribosomal protein S5 [Fimbriimonadaceae bacterium]QYK58268.1 MAG: 30S ribosomal protein S5 [Fimbriimonadaceae bacterium]
MGRGPRLTGRRQPSNQGRDGRQPEGPQLDVRVIRSNKVFKTHKGGKTASWSILVVVGDNKGQMGVGMGKARGIPDAIRKAEEAARKNMFSIPMIGTTIPHEVTARFGSSTVVLKPASPGTGVKAGSAVRQCLEAAGVHDVLAKCLGSRNGTNVAYATVKAVKELLAPEAISAKRSMDVNELVPWLAKARKEEADHA